VRQRRRVPWVRVLSELARLGIRAQRCWRLRGGGVQLVFERRTIEAAYAGLGRLDRWVARQLLAHLRIHIPRRLRAAARERSKVAA
jgi:hypothetical protein